MELLHQFWVDFSHNLFKPLLLFFYMGFLIPILKVPFEFPKVIYQGLTIYLLIAIGWHGGEQLAGLDLPTFLQAGGFMVIGFVLDCVIALVAYVFLRKFTRLRHVDAATVGGYYGSDSAGTFATCVGVLVAGGIAYAPYMPVMLAVMEMPGCLVALYLVARLRRKGLDAQGNMPDEPGYDPNNLALDALLANEAEQLSHHGPKPPAEAESEGEYHAAGAATAVAVQARTEPKAVARAAAADMKEPPLINGKILHEIFFNPGIFLLAGGIIIGFIGAKQGQAAVAQDNQLFINLFHGSLCLFLLEMGITACSRLRDLKTGGWRFIVFGVAQPLIGGTIGILTAHAYSMILGQPFLLGTYALFAVLCAASSYIAVPAVQRMAIPEASPTLPLAASLGLTFSFNVTLGIPIYILIAKAVMAALPVGAAATAMM